MWFKRLLRRRIKTKKDIDKKINRFIKRFGKTKEITDIKESLESDELKNKFFDQLFRLNYAKDKETKKRLLEEAKRLAKKIPELRTWPEDSKKFWEIESYSWLFKIPRRVRSFIKKELLKRIKPGTLNLAIGSGSYPYIEDSVLLDFSEEMLRTVPTVKFEKKVLHDINKADLPFKDNSFDSVTAVFIVDYLKNIKKAFKEIKRILRKNGKLIIVNSAKPINEFYQMQEKKFYTGFELKNLLKSVGFKVIVDEKKVDNTRLVFVEAEK